MAARVIAFLLVLGLWVSARVHAAELQIRTIDGQTVQGEYLGTDQNVVRLRCKYGVLEVPSKDIVTMTAVAPLPKNSEESNAVAVGKQAPEETRTFPETQIPKLMPLIAIRMAGEDVPEPTHLERLDLYRGIRTFSNNSNKGREKTIARFQDLGIKAYPFIAAAYTQPFEIGDKIDLLRVLAVPNSPFTAGVFHETHRTALALLNQAEAQPPVLQPEYVQNAPNMAEQLNAGAANVLAIEEYASIAGGPFNTLFLLEVYKRRYSAEKMDLLLSDIGRDRARLSSTAADAGQANSYWTAQDRQMLCEQLLPLLFKNNDDLNLLARELLKKLLPPGYPKWSAAQETWVEWWEKKAAFK